MGIRWLIGKHFLRGAGAFRFGLDVIAWFSIWLRLQLDESPLFVQLKADGW